MTREEILEGIIKIMETCNAECSCYDCAISLYCEEWKKMLDKQYKE